MMGPSHSWGPLQGGDVPWIGAGMLLPCADFYPRATKRQKIPKGYRREVVFYQTFQGGVEGRGRGRVRTRGAAGVREDAERRGRSFLLHTTALRPSSTLK